MTTLAIVVFVVRGRSETVQGLLNRRDERINAVDLHATAVAGVVVIAAVIAGLVVQIARGADPAPHPWRVGAAGVSYVVALITLRLRG
jgi:hypothetical protein